MAQHDHDIANASGAAVRADINALAAAQVSLNSGASAPSPAFAGQWWHDTATSTLKRRNAANTTWITIGPIDEALIAATESVKGIIEIATRAEQRAGTSDTLALTPLKHAAGGDGPWTDAASAGTVDLGAIDSRNIRITGTTTITALGTVDSGVRKLVRFAGVLIITHNATSLILPGGQNITTVANDIFEFVSLGSGNWICTQAPADMELLAVATASSSAQLDFTAFDSNKFSSYLFELIEIAPATDGVDLRVRVSTDGGSSYISTSAYVHARRQSFATDTGNDAAPAAESSWMIGQIGNSTAENHTGELTLFPSTNTRMIHHSMFVTATPTYVAAVGGGLINSANANAIRFFMSSGNIASGTIRMYGRRKS